MNKILSQLRIFVQFKRNELTHKTNTSLGNLRDKYQVIYGYGAMAKKYNICSTTEFIIPQLQHVNN